MNSPVKETEAIVKQNKTKQNRKLPIKKKNTPVPDSFTDASHQNYKYLTIPILHKLLQRKEEG